MAHDNNYREQAARSRREADATTLDNVRDRCLRSEAAWIAMAERYERTEAARASRRPASELLAEAAAAEG